LRKNRFKNDRTSFTISTLVNMRALSCRERITRLNKSKSEMRKDAYLASRSLSNNAYNRVTFDKATKAFYKARCTSKRWLASSTIKRSSRSSK